MKRTSQIVVNKCVCIVQYVKLKFKKNVPTISNAIRVPIYEYNNEYLQQLKENMKLVDTYLSFMLHVCCNTIRCTQDDFFIMINHFL